MHALELLELALHLLHDRLGHLGLVGLLACSCAISSASSLPSPSSRWIAFSCWRRKNSRWLRSISPLAWEEISCCMARTSSSLAMSSCTRRSRSTGSMASRISCAPSTLRSRLRGGEVGQAARLLHVGGDDDDLGRDGLAEVGRLLERGLDVAHQGLDLEALRPSASGSGIGSMLACRCGMALLEGRDARAADALHQHADAPVGQLQHAHDEGHGADGVDVVRRPGPRRPAASGRRAGSSGSRPGPGPRP